MKLHQKLLGLFIMIILLAQCKAVEQTNPGELTIKNLKVKKGLVSFKVVNGLGADVQVDGVENYYIERQEGEEWVFVPYTRCLCGSPCPPPKVKLMAADNEVEVRWERLSRKCKSRMPENPVAETIEEPATLGNYRMTLTILKSKDGKRLAPVKQYVMFELD